jgi:hypothetical protein
VEARASGEQFDAPRLGLDELLRQLIDRAHDVLRAQDKLRGLLEASQSIGVTMSYPWCCAESSKRPATSLERGTAR